MKFRYPFASVPIVAGICAAIGFVITLIDPGDDMDFVKLFLVASICGGIPGLITLACLAIPFAKLDERGYWQYLSNQGMQLVRPIRHGERFVVDERRLFVLLTDGEYEQIKLPRWAASKRVWARLEAAYPLELEQDDATAD
jgi:hypothetical protein